MLTLYRAGRKHGVGCMTVNELWKLVDEFNINISSIVGTGQNGRILKSDLINSVKPFLPANTYRVCVGSYETSQKLWIELNLDTWVVPFESFEKISIRKEYENYEAVRPSAKVVKISYDNNFGPWGNTYTEFGHGSTVKMLPNLRKAIIYLETRELYIKIKLALYQYLCLDVIKHISLCIVPYDVYGIVVK